MNNDKKNLGLWDIVGEGFYRLFVMDKKYLLQGILGILLGIAMALVLFAICIVLDRNFSQTLMHKTKRLPLWEMILFFLYGVWLMIFTTKAAIYSIRQKGNLLSWFGESVEDMLKGIGYSFLFSFLFSNIYFLIAGLISFALFKIPGLGLVLFVVSILSFLLGWVYIMLRLNALIPYALFIDRKGLFESIKYTWDLVGGNVLKVLLLSCILILGLIVIFVLTLFVFGVILVSFSFLSGLNVLLAGSVLLVSVGITGIWWEYVGYVLYERLKDAI